MPITPSQDPGGIVSGLSLKDSPRRPIGRSMLYGSAAVSSIEKTGGKKPADQTGKALALTVTLTAFGSLKSAVPVMCPGNPALEYNELHTPATRAAAVPSS